MPSFQLQGLLCIYCPGHAEVWVVNRQDRLASTAHITTNLQYGTAVVITGLRNFLNTNRPQHHSTDRLKEQGVEKGSDRHSTLPGREQSVFNQSNTCTLSRVTLKRLQPDGAEHTWTFLSATMLSWAETGTADSLFCLLSAEYLVICLNFLTF